MLLSLAGSTQSAPPSTIGRDETSPNGVRGTVPLGPEPTGSGLRATQVALAPVAQAARSVSTRGLMAADYQVLFEAQAQAQRDSELRILGVRQANAAFDAALREFTGNEANDPTVLRNGVVTLKLRSEQEARLARDIYERYQASRAVGATAEEIADLESRFARIAGWPPLPPVRAEDAQGGSLRGITSAISALEDRLARVTGDSR